MEEKQTLTKYYAVITDGDKYHKAGEEYLVPPGDLDRVKERGLKLEVWDDRFKTVYHLYPVAITKRVYRLDLIETDTVPGGDRNEYRKWGDTIGYDDIEKESYDWRDHWC